MQVAATTNETVQAFGTAQLQPPYGNQEQPKISSLI